MIAKRIATPLLGLVCGAAGYLAAQTLPPHDLLLLTGRGELLQFERDLQRVVVSEPKIADAVVVSPREVMVNAKAAGRATLYVWESGGLPARWDITVKDDTSERDQTRKRLEQGLGPGIKVEGTGDTLVLTGSVKSPEEAKKLAGIASGYAKNIVNLLQPPPPQEPRQVLLQVRFASINRSALSEIGFNFFSRNPKLIGELTTEQFQSPRFSQLQFQNQDFNNTSVNFADLLNIFAFRPDLNIGATIKALQARNLLQVLAEPNLITVEGKEASFLAGGSFPFPTLTTTSTGGAVSPVVTVQFKPFGVQLNFTPTILENGSINLKVAPEVSSLDYANAVLVQGFQIPALAQRRAETEVVLKDGESFAIAGLIDNRVIQTIERVPGLGSLPVVGNLFRSRSTRKTDDELLVVITPRFVKPLTAQEKAKLPDFPETFLPTVAEDKATPKKKGKGKSKTDPKPADAAPATNQPEFVGPRGLQEPKK